MRQPTRRSRRIGLTQGGRVRDGHPSERGSRVFARDLWDRLSTAPAHEQPVVLRENPSRAYFLPAEGTNTWRSWSGSLETFDGG